MWKVVLFLAVVMPALQTVGCSNEAKKEKLFIYNWTYYIPGEVIKEFERRFNVTVVYDMYASNEEMFAKLKAGGGGYDIVFPSGDYVSIMIREGMLEEIDKKKIPHFSLIDSSVLPRIRFDRGCRYSVPYIMGAAGITVNRKMVVNYQKSWKLFDRSDLEGRVTLLDDMREVIGAALRTLGYSINTVDTAQLRQAKEVVKGWRKNIVKFDAEAFGKGFAAGEFWAVHGYAENVFLELDSAQVSGTEFFIPQEGSCIYMDNMVLLKNGRNKELSYTFINYIHSPEVYARIVDFLGVPSLNIAANRYRKVPPRYELSDLAQSEFKEDLGVHLELYNTIWQEIRIGK
jgi:spermidine/putrescine transport system substrate-binding protein